MKINIIGGGPAGMYFAILMKKADAAHEITVYERNGPDDTFGWGVVFSGKTLANLRAADEESHAEITRAFRGLGQCRRRPSRRKDFDPRQQLFRHRPSSASEDSAATLRRTGRANCCSGPKFLILIRCAADCDLLVAADGVNSTARKQYSKTFPADVWMFVRIVTSGMARIDCFMV